jgi:hypothetical protein
MKSPCQTAKLCVRAAGQRAHTDVLGCQDPRINNFERWRQRTLSMTPVRTAQRL